MTTKHSPSFILQQIYLTKFTNRLDTNEVIDQIKSLFSGKIELISEFYKFLPEETSPQTENRVDAPRCGEVSSTKEKKLNIVSPSAAGTLQQAHAMNYVMKVRTRFMAQPLVYRYRLAVCVSFSKRFITQVLMALVTSFQRLPAVAELVPHVPEEHPGGAGERVPAVRRPHGFAHRVYVLPAGHGARPGKKNAHS